MAQQTAPGSFADTIFRISEDYILREIAGEYAIVPVGAAAQLTNAILSPNETAVFLWRLFEKGTSPEAALQACLAEYEVSETEARAAVAGFVKDAYQCGTLKTERE